ncbi:hypothetical protein HU675_0020325 [Bradyrhizobium septentrionale]|uniref:hypothetical protein n=1 Tax=Bradyrhizobium septentrionale TaxID=1404411 RepID=UPI0015971405|nr:hypothetical protein [Bradyrhizobium septentrionale]UGY28923.1 hypothetical protein HU675_0020325 [Bradyrhizobium septentrionale]
MSGVKTSAPSEEPSEEQLRLNEIEWQRDSLPLSQRPGTVYGSYSHKYLSVSVVSMRDIKSEQQLEELLAQSQDGAPLDSAMRDIVIFHEYRHFHDCFGTSAGFFLFLNYTQRLRAFLHVCRRLREEGVEFRFPFGEWIQQGDCPAYVKEFYRQLAVGTFYRLIFDGTCELPPQRGEDGEAWRDFLIRFGLDSIHIPAFPLTFGVQDPDEPEGLSPVVHWVPLGFNVLIEGNAQALQRYLLVSNFSEATDRELEIAQTWHVSHQPIDAKLDHLDITAGMVEPYRITDLLLSKYLRKHHEKIEKFPRSWITHLTDLALMASPMESFGEKTRSMPPGGRFVQMIELTKWPDSAEGSPEFPSSFSRDDLIAIRDTLRDCGRPEEITEQSVFSPVEYIARYARHHIIAPILDLRIQYGNEIFSDFELYLSKFSEFPFAPMVTVGGETRASGDAPPEFFYWWMRFVMIGEVAEQIWSGRRIICCPRAYPTVEGIAGIDFADKPGCEANLAAKICGTWDKRRTQALPNCYFGFLMKGLFGRSAPPRE